MAANDPGTYVDTPGGRMTAVALFYWNGSAYVASSGGPRMINTPVASVGNGADTTEDTLQTFSIPAGTLRTVGDRLRIVAGGTYGATTDSKTVRIRIAGVAYAVLTATVAAAISWRSTLDVVKTGSNTQIGTALGGSHTVTAQSQNVVGSLTDTGALSLTVTGQNNTNSVAGSVVCNYLSVEYVPA